MAAAVALASRPEESSKRLAPAGATFYKVEVRSKKYEERNLEIDCADSDIDSDCTGNDAGSDVVYVTSTKDM